MRPRRPLFLASLAILSLIASVAVFRSDNAVLAGGRLDEPEDRYAMAGGCYAVEAANGKFVRRVANTAVLADGMAAQAEPFFFKATDLGSYLLYGSQKTFLSAIENAAGQALYPATRSTPGQIAGGVAIESTDKVADAIARGEAGKATRLSNGVQLAGAASDLGDWEITQTGANAFTLALPATNQVLGLDGQALKLFDDVSSASPFSFFLTDGCAEFPEIPVNIDGEAPLGASPFAEVKGTMDAHLHMMAYEFIGGRSRCGKPWHRFGVAHALVDCPDHGTNGATAVLEHALSGPRTHDPSGWPSFTGWPKNFSLTHEQAYYTWLERAWRGGLRLMTNLLVDNHALCEIYPYKKNSCNEMDGVRLQAQRLREIERYIDAQSGGPGEGWFRIVTDPHQARRTINAGKLAVIMGVEVSTPLDCAVVADVPLCSEEQIDRELDALYALGVRQMELANKFDNALTGVTGDAGQTGIVVNQGNKRETGNYWRMETCADDEHGHDKTQSNPHDSGFPRDLTKRDAFFGAVLQTTGTTGVAPVYPEGPHCNVMGLTELGEYAVKGLAKRGIIFDPDHMSAKARHQALDVLASIGYSGVVSSHSWADDTIYHRIYDMGGVVTPHAGSSSSFKNTWAKRKSEADPRFYWGIGYGSDVNGFSTQGYGRNPTDGSQVTYPFTGFGGITVHKQVSGTRTWDINTDGVAHYGMYPDWIEDLRKIAGQEIVDDVFRGAEAFLQMWERASGIAGDACRSDIADLTDAQVAAIANGMTPEEVLDAVGQANSRTGTAMTFCMTGARTATVTFNNAAVVSGVSIS